MATALKISYPEELIPELMSKVVGHSTLAKLSDQTPIPFSGTEQFVFNLDGNAQIVGEGEQKLAGKLLLVLKSSSQRNLFIKHAFQTSSCLHLTRKKSNTILGLQTVFLKSSQNHLTSQLSMVLNQNQ